MVNLLSARQYEFPLALVLLAHEIVVFVTIFGNYFTLATFVPSVVIVLDLISVSQF